MKRNGTLSAEGAIIESAEDAEGVGSGEGVSPSQ